MANPTELKEYVMGKKGIQENFKIDEAMSEELRQAMMALDANKSEIIRACLALGLPQLRANPILLNAIELARTAQ